ncbi:hypothetical protein ACFL5N_02965, partial [bacterium]
YWNLKELGHNTYRIEDARELNEVYFYNDKIFVVYNESSLLIISGNKTEIINGDFYFIKTNKYLKSKNISQINTQLLKKEKETITKRVKSLQFSYAQNNYLSNILNISRYPKLKNILSDFKNKNFVHYLCSQLTSNELKIFDNLVGELKKEALELLLQTFRSYRPELDLASEIKAIIGLKKDKTRTQIFEEYIYTLSSIYRLKLNKEIKTLLRHAIIYKKVKSISIKQLITVWINNKLRHLGEKSSLMIVNLKNINSIKNEEEWLELWKNIDNIKKYLEKNLGGNISISYRDVMYQFPTLQKKIINKKQKRYFPIISKVLKKAPLLIAKDKKTKSKLIEIFKNGPLYRQYKKRKQFIMPPVLEDLEFESWEIFRKLMKVIFPHLSVNITMRLVQKIFTNLDTLSKKGLSVENNLRIVYSV